MAETEQQWKSLADRVEKLKIAQAKQEQRVAQATEAVKECRDEAKLVFQLDSIEALQAKIAQMEKTESDALIQLTADVLAAEAKVGEVDKVLQGA